VVKVFANKAEMPSNIMTYFRRQLKKSMGLKTALPKLYWRNPKMVQWQGRYHFMAVGAWA